MQHVATGLKHVATGLKHVATGLKHVATGLKHAATGLYHVATGLKYLQRQASMCPMLKGKLVQSQHGSRLDVGQEGLEWWEFCLQLKASAAGTTVCMQVHSCKSQQPLQADKP